MIHAPTPDLELIEQDRLELLRELDLLKTQFPLIYQQTAQAFCDYAKKGRATFDPPISYPEDLRVQGILAKYPSYCFYGAGCPYNLRLAWVRIKAVRAAFNASLYPTEPEQHVTALERVLYKCKQIERTHPQAPISAQNPLLLALVTLIEEYLAQP